MPSFHRSRIGLAAILVVACRAVPEPPQPITLPFSADTQRVEVVHDGVVHRFIYSPEGPWAIHVLEAHAGRCWSLAALKSTRGAIGREVTSALVRAAGEREEVAGGVNADFFLFTPPGVPVGLLIADGRLITGPIHQPVLAADSSGRVHIARFETMGQVVIGGERFELSRWNRNAPSGLAVFDAAWGSATDTASGVIEAVIEGTSAYRVATVDTTFAGVPIPAVGAVLRVGRNAPDALRTAVRSLSVGTTVQIDRALSPFFPRDAVGGRPVLVNDGVISPQLDSVGRSGFATSRHPRTAAGISRGGDRIFLVTVDGRQAPYSDGMTLLELAELMQALGAHDAINLDGGGSTAMVVADRDGGFRVVNHPSDRGGERAVGDAVALVKRCR